MKWVVIVSAALVLFALPVEAQTRAYRLHNGRMNVYHYDGYERGIRVWRFDDRSPSNFGIYFPFGPGGITAGIKNPNPRRPEEIPGCYYGVDGKLFFAQAGKDCAPDWNNRATQE